MMARILGPLLALVCGAALGAPAPALAQGTAQAPVTNFKIGYLEIEDDPLYDREFVYALTMPDKTRVRIPAVPRYRPLAGAKLGMDEANQTGRFTRESYDLVPYAGASAKDLIAWIEKARSEQRVNFFLIDGDTNVIREVSQAVRGQDVMLINVSNHDDRLRGQFCARNLAHTAPSYNMLTDAVTQYLVYQGWVNILLLTGPLEEDVKFADALKRSIRRNGARLVEERKFIASNDPRQREQNNTRLLTGGNRDYDAVFLADTDGEFARTFPYQTVRARPVVGAAGLQPEQWHWTWERQGAPQLSSRFHAASSRLMYEPRLVGVGRGARVGAGPVQGEKSRLSLHPRIRPVGPAPLRRLYGQPARLPDLGSTAAHERVPYVAECRDHAGADGQIRTRGQRPRYARRR